VADLDSATLARTVSKRSRIWDRLTLSDHPLLRVWAVATALFFGLCAVWSLATPIDATNDEGSQVIKAVSVVRGEILGTPLTAASARSLPKSQVGLLNMCEVYVNEYPASLLHRKRVLSNAEAAARCSAPFTIVTVPQSFTTLAPSETCNSTAVIPDECPTHLDGSKRSVEAITYVGRYPPLYYAVVGLPSLVSASDNAIYGMRLVSGLVTAALLGLSIALVTTWSSRRLILLAVIVAATPMLFVFGSTVNPSGLEMSAALCAWTGLLILVLEHAKQPPPSLVAACTAASVVMAFCRPLSPFWLVLIAVFVAALRPAAIRSLAADRRIRIGSVVVAVAILVAVVYVVWAKSLTVLPVGSVVLPNTPISGVVELALGRTDVFISQFAGAFGWDYVSPPLAGIALLIAAVGGLVLGGIVTGARRDVAVLAALIVTALVLPLLIVVSQANKDGIVWQARDGFPLYGGVILVAGAIARAESRAGESSVGNRVVRRLTVIVAVGVAGSQLADLLWAMRRYNVGLWGPLNAFAKVPGGFSPSVPTALLVVASLGLCAAYGWWIIRLSAGMASPATSSAGVL
jgi:Predicted membrane protein (DUF2142)